jgi:hypothetical protein
MPPPHRSSDQGRTQHWSPSAPAWRLSAGRSGAIAWSRAPGATGKAWQRGRRWPQVLRSQRRRRVLEAPGTPGRGPGPSVGSDRSALDLDHRAIEAEAPRGELFFWAWPCRPRCLGRPFALDRSKALIRRMARWCAPLVVLMRCSPLSTKMSSTVASEKVEH